MFIYCLNNPVVFIDSDGRTTTMAIGCTIAATNWWNPAGWTAIGVMILEGVIILICAVGIFDAISNANHHKKNKSSSRTTQVTSTPASPPPGNNRDPKWRAGTTYNKNGIRIDYEYNGNGTGRVHLQTTISAPKYYYDAINNVFRVGLSSSSALAPKGIQKLLEDPEIVKAIAKALRYISE